MGSRISSIVAHLYLVHLEDMATDKQEESRIEMYARYVDDVFVLYRGSWRQAEQLQTKLNSIHKKIQFTMEKEEDETLSFLDVKITRVNKILETTVYRKNTHTDSYLNWNSAHPTCHKISVLRALRDRAISHCSTPALLKAEISHINEALTRNGHPSRLLQNYKKREKKQGPAPRIWMTLPYVKGVSENTANRLKRQFPSQIRIGYKPAPP